MILAAQRDWDIDLPRSLLLGDSASDLEAGAAAGVGSCMIAHTVSESVSGGKVLEPALVHNILDLLGTHSMIR